MSDKVNAARVAWALITLSEVDTRLVYLGQLSDRVGLAAEEGAAAASPDLVGKARRPSH